MAKYEITVIRDDMERHLAVTAWRQLDQRGRRPTSIEVLKPEKRKSAVFRINGVGAAGRPVIAKRRPAGDVDVELRLYTELLPALSIPALELYGFVSDEGYSWLFLEDAGEVWYSPNVAEHRALAVEWLAGLHTQTATTDAWFPRTGTEYFRAQVAAAKDGVRVSLGHPNLTPADVVILQHVLSHLDTVERRWEDVEAACAGMPEALVHGDFVPKNVRIRRTQRAAELVAFDWETAGWATPAADLALLPGDGGERRRYHRQVVSSWPTIRPADIERLWRVGTVLRLVHAVHWETRSFRHSWIQRAMRNMAAYDRYLREAVRGDGWFV